MRVLVTGNNGYIGTILVPMLIEKGHEVIGLDTDYYGQCTFTGDVPDVRTINKDVRDIEKHDVEVIQTPYKSASHWRWPTGSLTHFKKPGPKTG